MSGSPLKPLRLRESAERDLLGAFEHYRLIDIEIAARFIDAFAQAREQIERECGIGSPRYAEVTGVIGLRSWALNRFPYLLFYVERDGHLDGIRLLHQHADIPVHLSAPAPDAPATP